MVLPRAGPERTRSLEQRVGVLSIAGGLLHAILSPSHLAEWWGYGLFFFFAAAAQVVFGVAVLARAFDESSWGAGWRAAKRNWLVLGIAGNAAIILLYLVTRTIGIPWFGTEAGVVERVGVIDVVSKLIEAVLIAYIVLLLRDLPKETAAAPRPPPA
jgi:hypothetical protein